MTLSNRGLITHFIGGYTNTNVKRCGKANEVPEIICEPVASSIKGLSKWR